MMTDSSILFSYKNVLYPIPCKSSVNNINGCISIVLLSKVLHNLPPIRPFTHSHADGNMQGVGLTIRSNWGSVSNQRTLWHVDRTELPTLEKVDNPLLRHCCPNIKIHANKLIWFGLWQIYRFTLHLLSTFMLHRMNCLHFWHIL